MSCDKCDGQKIVYQDGDPKRCDCLKKDRFRDYLSDLGGIQKPPDDLVNEISVDNVFQNLYIDVREDIIGPELHGLISYYLIQAYPASYTRENVSALRVDMSGNNDYSKVVNFNEDIVILTMGLGCEFEGVDRDGNDWTEDAYTRIVKQVVGHRMNEGKLVWAFRINQKYSQIDAYLTNQGLTKEKLSIKADSSKDHSKPADG